MFYRLSVSLEFQEQFSITGTIKYISSHCINSTQSIIFNVSWFSKDCSENTKTWLCIAVHLSLTHDTLFSYMKFSSAVEYGNKNQKAFQARTKSTPISIMVNVHIIWRYIDAYMCAYLIYRVFPGGWVVKNLPTNARDVGDTDSIPGWGRSPGVGSGSPLHYSCLEYSMDRGACQPTVHGAPKSWTWLSSWAHIIGASLEAQSVKNLPAMQDRGSILGSGISPGEGNGNLLQYSYLENPMDRKAWWATVHRVQGSDVT